MRRSTRSALVNPIVSVVLRSPLHSVLSGALILVGYRGRRTGRPHTLPVMYAQEGKRLIVLVGNAPAKRWWRNLRGGAPVDVRLRGAQGRGRATVVAGTPADIGAPLRTYLRRFPRAGRAVREDGVVMVLIDLRPQDEPRGTSDERQTGLDLDAR